MSPSTLDIVLLNAKNRNNTDTNIRNKPSLLNIVFFISRTAITPEIPKTNPMLAMLDPTMFPIINPVLPLNAATIEEANSGSDVPNATIVKPIRKSETPKCLASFDAESTKKSEPFIKTANATPNIKNSMPMPILKKDYLPLFS